MEKIDIVIAGGGIVGLAAAAGLSAPGRTLFVAERNEAFGMETSSRNSEVIHSGIYYPIGSLKHLLCIEGNRMLYAFCDSNAVKCQKTGKYIVASTDDELAELEELFENGKRNGVPGLELKEGTEVESAAPGIRCRRALFSPSSGIVDSHGVMEVLLSETRSKAGDIVYNTEIVSVEKNGASGFLVHAREKSGQEFEIKASLVVNCCGLDADILAAACGIDTEDAGYGLHYCKGSYFRLSGSRANGIRRLIYPAVEKGSPSLGIHVTPDLGGGIRLGPDAEYIAREKDYRVDETKKEVFYREVKKFFPAVEQEALMPDTAGIRPKLQGPGDGFRDFIIKEEAERGLPGLINLIGIESPGLTACLAIAGRVKELAEC